MSATTRTGTRDASRRRNAMLQCRRCVQLIARASRLLRLPRRGYPYTYRQSQPSGHSIHRLTRRRNPCVLNRTTRHHSMFDTLIKFIDNYTTVGANVMRWRGHEIRYRRADIEIGTIVCFLRTWRLQQGGYCMAVPGAAFYIFVIEKTSQIQTWNFSFYARKQLLLSARLTHRNSVVWLELIFTRWEKSSSAELNRSVMAGMSSLQYPNRLARRNRESRRARSAAEHMPDHAGAVYWSLDTTAAQNTSSSDAAGVPWVSRCRI